MPAAVDVGVRPPPVADDERTSRYAIERHGEMGPIAFAQTTRVGDDANRYEGVRLRHELSPGMEMAAQYTPARISNRLRFMHA